MSLSTYQPDSAFFWQEVHLKLLSSVPFPCMYCTALIYTRVDLHRHCPDQRLKARINKLCSITARQTSCIKYIGKLHLYQPEKANTSMFRTFKWTIRVPKQAISMTAWVRCTNKKRDNLCADWPISLPAALSTAALITAPPGVDHDVWGVSERSAGLSARALRLVVPAASVPRWQNPAAGLALSPAVRLLGARALAPRRAAPCRAVPCRVAPAPRIVLITRDRGAGRIPAQLMHFLASQIRG